jgi:hypothetical protein
VISWRYHVVSIVAIVLAFGLGILAGTSVIDEGFTQILQRNYDDATRERDEAVAQVAFYERFAEALQPTLRDDILLGEEAVVVTVDGIDRQSQRTVEELTAAGADVLAMLELSRTLADPRTNEDVAALAAIADMPDLDPETIRIGVADALAGRLADGAVDGQEDLLGALLSDGFATADRDLDPDALLGIGGPGQLVVIAAGGRALPSGLPRPQSLLVPFTERLVQRGVPTAAVGPTEDAYGFVSAVRDANGIPDCSMVTVDNIELQIGGITLAMALDRYLDDDDPTVRPGGDYGVGGDAIILPGAQEPPESCLV